MLDLSKYCERGESSRPYLRQPFSHGDFTYATNGHIMVRIPRRDDVPPPDMPKAAETLEVRWDKPLEGHDTAIYTKTLPELPERGQYVDPCPRCDGTGRGHDCPDCQCECHDCVGTGFDDPDKGAEVLIGVGKFAVKYIRMVAELPGIEIMEYTQKGDPILFRFDGGIGAVMPLRS